MGSTLNGVWPITSYKNISWNTRAREMVIRGRGHQQMLDFPTPSCEKLKQIVLSTLYSFFLLVWATAGIKPFSQPRWMSMSRESYLVNIYAKSIKVNKGTNSMRMKWHEATVLYGCNFWTRNSEAYQKLQWLNYVKLEDERPDLLFIFCSARCGQVNIGTPV